MKAPPPVLRQRRSGDVERGWNNLQVNKLSYKRRVRWRTAALVIAGSTVTAGITNLLLLRQKCGECIQQEKRRVVRLFSFHKNEKYLLGDWLNYHCYLFGCENIVVIDHNSDDPFTQSVLERYARRGVAVVPFKGSFKEKAETLSIAMRASTNTADLLVPIDIDEFIVLEDRAQLSVNRNQILATFQSLVDTIDMRKFKFNARVADCPDVEGVEKRPALAATRFSPPRTTSMGKTFFRARDFISTDQGNHFGRVRYDNGTDQDTMLKPKNFNQFFQRTNLTLLHFSMPDFQTWHTKLAQRAKAYGFNMQTNCNAVRKGQRYCRSFQSLRAGTAPLDEARAEYRAVCSAIANQQNMYNPHGGASSLSSSKFSQYTVLANFLRSLPPSFHERNPQQ